MDNETGHLGDSKFGEIDSKTCNKGTIIQEFYRDCNVFITGGTGFMGKLLIEKLLRSCPATKKIFIIIRPKRGKSPEERKEKLLNCVIFNSLKATNPIFHEKLVMVSGDISLPNLGLSPLDYEMLTQQVNIIFHLAATVKFDEKMNIAVPINIIGTIETINLCRKCVNLKSMVYVSTAYSNCHLKEIKECFYKPPLEEDVIIKFLPSVDEVIMEVIKPIHGFDARAVSRLKAPFSLSCSVLESGCRRSSSCVGVHQGGIYRVTAEDGEIEVRISISIIYLICVSVAGTLKEPLIGWIDNIYGPIGAVVGIGAGLLRTGIRKADFKSDIIPGDLVINGIIVAAYDVAVR
uniref:Fatty acyl-CoA reductase n=1 Tax=Timema genevievae TaxID=629358 RepID=A0A7R9K4S0_TIMGE|nr:unnamed protein product [Timema genevievae]